MCYPVGELTGGEGSLRGRIQVHVKYNVVRPEGEGRPAGGRGRLGRGGGGEGANRLPLVVLPLSVFSSAVRDGCPILPVPFRVRVHRVEDVPFLRRLEVGLVSRLAGGRRRGGSPPVAVRVFDGATVVVREGSPPSSASASASTSTSNAATVTTFTALAVVVVVVVLNNIPRKGFRGWPPRGRRRRKKSRRRGSPGRRRRGGESRARGAASGGGGRGEG